MRRVAPGVARHRRHQSQCLRSWAGRDGAGAGRRDAFGVARLATKAWRCALPESQVPIVLLEGVFSSDELQAAGARAVRTRRAFVRAARPAGTLRRHAALRGLAQGRIRGMNRLGFRLDEFADGVAPVAAAAASVRSVRLMTHLALRRAGRCDVTASSSAAFRRADRYARMSNAASRIPRA